MNNDRWEPPVWKFVTAEQITESFNLIGSHPPPDGFSDTFRCTHWVGGLRRHTHYDASELIKLLNEKMFQPNSMVKPVA